MQIEKPYLMFIGDVQDQLAAKTAAGIVDWRRDWCVGQLRLPGCKADLGLEDVTVKEGRARGANTMVVGVVNAGGVLPDHWIRTIVAAIRAGMDIATGLHKRLEDVPEIAAAAREHGRQLHNVRIPSITFPTGKGVKRSGMRLLTVGTDCSVGKKYTALALEKEMRAQGFDADFRATGQTGILISGRGVAVDAVVADFISGAAEWLTPDADPGHWDVVEGQGSLFHPSFAGVTLGLLHGSQPDAFVVCDEPTRTTMRGVEQGLPTIRQVIEATIACGRLTNPGIRCVGIAVNTAALDEEEARRMLAGVARAEGLPATDPVRFGVAAIVQELKRVYVREPEPIEADDRGGEAQGTTVVSQAPAAEERDSVVAAQESAVAAQESAVAAQETAVAAQESAVAAQETAVAAQGTAVAAQEPAVEAQETAVEAQGQAVEAQEPAVEAQEPAVETQEPAVEAQEPAVEAETAPTEAISSSPARQP